jgi:hypothetical protein
MLIWYSCKEIQPKTSWIREKSLQCGNVESEFNGQSGTSRGTKPSRLSLTTKGNELATLAVFTRRAIHQEKVVPIRFGDEGNQFSLRKRTDGQVLAEFQHWESDERVPLSESERIVIFI